ncbi:MAG TPA: AI-2E family transporter [Thermomicrobiales bacterium]|jgi:predicted PurR-regulated permease PerM
MSNARPQDGEVPEVQPGGQANATQMSGQVPTIPVPGVGQGGGQTSGQATAAVPVVSVETDEHPRRGLTPATFLLTLFAAYFLYKVQIVVITLIVGILLATAITGPIELLTRRFHLPRALSILLVYIGIIAGLGLFLYLLVPPVIGEGTRFAREVPTLLENWRGQLLANNNALIRNAATRAFEAIDGVAAGGGGGPVSTNVAVGVVSGIGGGLVTLFTLFLIAFYWITEKTLIKRAVSGLFAPGQRARVLHLWHEVEIKLGAWIRGQLLLMATIGGLATIAYGLMGLPFWLVLGVIAGLTEAIPNVGPILGAIPAVLIALSVDWKLALGVVAFVCVLQLLENAVLVPRIMKGAVGLSPLTVILAILAGSEFRGVAGALLAVPIAGAIAVILNDMLREKREREQQNQDLRPRDWLRQAWRWRRGATTPAPNVVGTRTSAGE